MPENTDAQRKLNPSVSETPREGVFEDTVLLPSTNGEYIHIETTAKRLADSFGEFAGQFGTPAGEARGFWRDRVSFQFGTVGDEPFSKDNDLGDIWAKVWKKLPSPFRQSGVIGSVTPGLDGMHVVWIGTQNIARVLPRFQSKDLGFQVTPE